MVEVLVCLMSLYIDYLGAGATGQSTQTEYQPSMVPLGEMVIIALTELLTGSSQNSGVFRELGGAKLAGHLVMYQDTRDPGLGLLQQLGKITYHLIPFNIGFYYYFSDRCWARRR